MTSQPAGRISSWREEFLAAGREGLKARPRAPEERELTDAQRKIGAQAQCRATFQEPRSIWELRINQRDSVAKMVEHVGVKR